MEPVCPACRTAVGLDIRTCPGCGLAVRPTCRVCFEPLTVGMTACWRCATSIEEPFRAPAPAPVEPPVAPPPASPPPAPPPPARAPVPDPDLEMRFASQAPAAQQTAPQPVVVAAPAATMTAPLPVTAPPPVMYPADVWQRHDTGDGRFRLWRSIGVGVLSGLLVALALIAAEIFLTRYLDPAPRDVALHEERFDRPGFAISVPGDWAGNEPGDGSVQFADLDDRIGRGLNVVDEPVDFGGVLDVLARYPGSVTEYTKISTGTGPVLGGKPSYHHRFIVGELGFEQYWVDHDEGKTLKLEFRFHPGAADEATDLDRRIADTLQVL